MVLEKINVLQVGGWLISWTKKWTPRHGKGRLDKALRVSFI